MKLEGGSNQTLCNAIFDSTVPRIDDKDWKKDLAR